MASDLSRPGMNGHGKREVADPGKHVHHILALADAAHSHALFEVSRREHDKARIQMEDHLILVYAQSGSAAGDGPADWLPEGARNALIGQDGAAAGIKVQKGLADMVLESGQFGMNLHHDYLSQYEPAARNEIYESIGNLSLQCLCQIRHFPVEGRILLHDDLAAGDGLDHRYLYIALSPYYLAAAVKDSERYQPFQRSACIISSGLYRQTNFSGCSSAQSLPLPRSG